MGQKKPNMNSYLNSELYWISHKLLWYIVEGVAGQVLDSSGSVIRNASITIDSNAGIFSSSEDGHFYILLTQGPHTIHIKAEGQNQLC